MEENGGCGLYLSPDFSYAIKNKSSGNMGGNFSLDGLHYFPVSGDEANREL